MTTLVLLGLEGRPLSENLAHKLQNYYKVNTMTKSHDTLFLRIRLDKTENPDLL